MDGGPVRYAAEIKVTEDSELKTVVKIFPDHEQDLYVFDPSVFFKDFHPVVVGKDGSTLTLDVGAPGLRKDGLLRMVLLRPREGHVMELLLMRKVDMSDVQSIRLGLLFLPDPDGTFEKAFSKLEETPVTWYTEVGSPIWCAYMSHLVYDEITIPIRTNIHVCDE